MNQRIAPSERIEQVMRAFLQCTLNLLNGQRAAPHDGFNRAASHAAAAQMRTLQCDVEAAKQRIGGKRAAWQPCPVSGAA
jgi:hypothetical protein